MCTYCCKHFVNSYIAICVAPMLTASLTPSVISGDERTDSIAFICSPSVVEDVASPSYQYTWMRNENLIDLTDPRITVCNTQYIFSLTYVHVPL